MSDDDGTRQPDEPGEDGPDGSRDRTPDRGGEPSAGQPAQGGPDRGQPDQDQPGGGHPGQGQPARGQPGQGQPAPGQGQPAGGEPGGGPTGGHAAGGTEPSESVVDRLQQPVVRDELKVFVGVYAVLAVGLGLTGLLTTIATGFPLDPDTVGAAELAAVWLLAPTLAAVLSLRLADGLDRDPGTVAAAAAVGSAIGSVGLTLVAGILIAAVVGGLVTAIIATFVVTIAATAVGGAVAFLRGRVRV